MKKRSIWWFFFVTITLSVLLTGCQLFPAEEQLPLAPVIHDYETTDYTQAAVLRGDLFLTKKVQCEYMPAKRENLSFALGGEYIENIYVSDGQQVKKGDLLAELAMGDLTERIENCEYEIAVLELRITHLNTNWSLELQRLDILRADDEEIEALNETYKKQLQSLEDSLYIENVRLEELNTQLRSRQIYAGMDGTVTNVTNIKMGDRSEKGRTVITIDDVNSTAFVVKGDNTVYFTEGQQVFIQYENQEYPAIVVSAAQLGLSSSSDTPITYLKLTEPDTDIKDGAFATMDIVLDSRIDVLYVTKDAIKSADNRTFVYVLNENGLKVMQDITVGLAGNDCVEIISGLEEGDSVIIG